MTKYQSRVVQICLSIPTVLCFSSTKLPSNSPFLNKIDELDNKQNRIRDVNFRLNPYNIIRDNLFSLNISPPDGNANNEISTPSSGNNIQHHTSLFSSRVETPGEENKGNFFAITNNKTMRRQFDVEKLSEFNSLLMSSPLFCWFEDITNAFTTMIHIPDRPIPSEQKQLALHLRVAKSFYEESMPWMLTFCLSSIVSMTSDSTLPLLCSLFIEFMFFISCFLKLVTKFDVPSRQPQPLLNDRDWNNVFESIYESQSFEDSEAKKKWLSDWFYGSSFSRLRRQDVVRFLIWMRYGDTEENIDSSQRLEIETVFLPRIEKEFNDGMKFPNRSEGEKPLGCIRFNLEPLRFRHKPLIFYAFINGTKYLVNRALASIGFEYVSPKDHKKDLGYFYRAGNKEQGEYHEESDTPLVFVHGVGGLSYYYQLIEELTRNVGNAPIVLIDLPFVSLQIADEIPDVIDQVQSVCEIMKERFGEDTKATFAGHSYGSLILSWMVQNNPEKIANLVFLDPIVFELHRRNVLFNFHFQRVDEQIQAGKSWDSPLSMGSIINLAGTEMHTNNAMLRHFWWATNALWTTDLQRNKITTSIMLSEEDDIVPSIDVHRSIQSNLTSSYKHDNLIIRSELLKGAKHGEFAFDETHRSKVVRRISAMMKLDKLSKRKEKEIQVPVLL